MPSLIAAGAAWRAGMMIHRAAEPPRRLGLSEARVRATISRLLITHDAIGSSPSRR